MTKLATLKKNFERHGLDQAVPLIDMVCRLAGPTSFVSDSRAQLYRLGITRAVRDHDTNAIFDWLMTVLSYQGIADRVAKTYIETHGSVSRAEVQKALRLPPTCPKLGGFWLFNRCGYEKGSGDCGEPEHFAGCPLPSHPLRNGRLNQTAYSLALFIRDIARGDLVRWLDDQISACADEPQPIRLASMRSAVVEPLCGVYGVSDKVVTMALSTLFLGAGARKRHWQEVGGSFIVVDTLVHNFLHRTGILRAMNADHLYGLGCYKPGGCADVLYKVSEQIDARAFNPYFPKRFPRFVQLAIWYYCSEGGKDVCNGNRIDDKAPCANHSCQLSNRCDRVTLLSENMKKGAKSAV